METQLTYDNRLKHLGLRVKERYTTRDGLHARITGLLDTVTGRFQYAARLEKLVGPPLPSATAPWRTKREQLATPRGALGVAYCSRRDAVLARAAAGGAADLGNEAWIAGKAVVEVDTRTQKARGYGRVSLSKNFFDFTPTQQLRIAAGLDFNVDDKGRVTRFPFLMVRENCWSLLADDKGRVSLRYDL